MKLSSTLLLIISAVVVKEEMEVSPTGAMLQMQSDKPKTSALGRIGRVLLTPIRLASKLKYAILGPKLTYEDKEMIRDKAWRAATDEEVADLTRLQTELVQEGFTDLTVYQVFKYKSSFKKVDKDNDGVINHADLKAYFASLGQELTDGESSTILLGKDNMGLRDFIVMMKTDVKIGEDAIRDLFNMMDTNRDGVVSEQELYAACKSGILGEDFTEVEDMEIAIEHAYELAGVQYGTPLGMPEFRRIINTKTTD